MNYFAGLDIGSTAIKEFCSRPIHRPKPGGTVKGGGSIRKKGV